MAIALGFVTLYATNLVYVGRSSFLLWLTIAIRAVGLALLASFATRWFVGAVVRKAWEARGIRELLTVLYSLLLLALTLELLFMFVPRSHGMGFTLGARIWDSYFWGPINSLGYRDREPPSFDPRSRYILAVGDSFTEGHGLRFVEQRFTELLEDRLGPPHRVLNLGSSGSDTRSQLRNLQRYPLQPHLIILQYFGNDIEEVAAEKGLTFDAYPSYDDKSAVTRFFIENSFLVNFLYWSVPADPANRRYAEFMEDCYADGPILRRHFRDLAKFIEYASERNVPLLVVIFPFLEEGMGSMNHHVRVVGDFFESSGVPVISVAELIRELRPIDRVVNRQDGHASAEVHERVAQAALPWVLRLLQRDSSDSHGLENMP
ncbi:MAG TPA: SGNH/GDSL hydrolase family protein [Vicinamibacteria bacterium]|nr:SGNH/GDSL hydrolase family protein [Vicinamibacteria bacterium]